MSSLFNNILMFDAEGSSYWKYTKQIPLVIDNVAQLVKPRLKVFLS